MDCKIVRVLICLLLVCSLLVNVSPIRVEALVIETALTYASYFALGCAALLLLDMAGVVYQVATGDDIASLGKIFDQFMIDGTSAFDYTLEEYDDFRQATIIQFSPDPVPDDGDDDSNIFRVKTLETALNLALVHFCKVMIDKTLQAQRSHWYNTYPITLPNEIVPAYTKVASTDGDREGCYATVDCWVLRAYYLWRNNSIDYYCSGMVFIPSDIEIRASGEGFSVYAEYQDVWKDSVFDIDQRTFSYSDVNDTIYYAYTFGNCFKVSSPESSSPWFYENLDYIYYLNATLAGSSHRRTGAAETIKALYYGAGSLDVTDDLLNSVYVGPVPDAVENGVDIEDIEFVDIEYGAIIDDPSDPESSIIENQEQMANGDKTYDQFIEEVAPGESVIIPETTVTPEPEPSVQPSEDPEVDPTFVPEIEPSESPEVDPDPDPTTSVDPTPDPGTDANPSWLQSLLNGLWELLQRLADLILNGIKSIFVPSEDYVTAKVDALRENFGFIDSVITTGEYIRDSISGDSGPPEIYVDLTAADGDTNWGEKVLLTDFSWYAPYKSNVDTVLSAALWAFFGWRVFMRLPGIISGESGYVGDVFRQREKTKKE